MKNTPYQAPDFSLPDENGSVHTLKDFAGQWLVLYFYPADDTPGCTVEACSLRDARDDIAELGAQIVGVSKDDAASHEKQSGRYGREGLWTRDSSRAWRTDCGRTEEIASCIINVKRKCGAGKYPAPLYSPVADRKKTVGYF